MSRRFAILVLAALTAPLAARADDALLVESGARVFQRYCAACHGVDGRGNGPVAPALTTRPADLTGIAARRQGEFPADEVALFIDGRADVVAHGPREMPVWGRVLSRPIVAESTGEEVVRGQLLVLVEYLASIQAPAETP